MGSITNCRKPVHNKTFGMELEGFFNCQILDKYEINNFAPNAVGFWEISSDGSLRPGEECGRDFSYYGREMISQPMPYAMLRQQIIKLHKKFGGWKHNSTCGLHIHVSRYYWSESREKKFSGFLKTLSPTQIEELFGRFSVVYANPRLMESEKFRAVNLVHEHTFEFRLWAAGDSNWTLEALRRTKLIVEYRGEWSYKKILDLFTKPE